MALKPPNRSSKANASREGSTIVQSIERAMGILQIIAEKPDGISFQRVLDQSKLPRSTTHRLLKALETSGMLTRQRSTKRYMLGRVAIKVGAAALSQIELREKAYPVMQRLRDASCETVSLNIRAGNDSRIYLFQLESRRELKASAEIGRLYPLYLGAPGRVLLAFLPDSEIQRILDSSHMIHYAPNSPKSHKSVWNAIHRIRREGLAYGFQELFEGCNTVSVPVRDYTSSVIAALSIAGPAVRLTDPQLTELAPSLLGAAESLSQELGYFGRSATSGRIPR